MSDTLKSVSITNLDAVPIVPNATGVGAVGYLKNVSDFITPTGAGLQLTTSTYKMLRVPTTIKLKALTMAADGALDTSTGLALDVGAYYSDSKNDGTAVANQGVLISAACFSAINIAFRSSAHAKTDVLDALAVAKRNQPLWKAVGLASDPGGNIDIVVAVHTAATTGGIAPFNLSADYVE